jgi:flagellar motor component MotA
MTHDEFVKNYTEIAWRALQCSMKARREGLLALEKELDQEKINERDILEYGLRFVVDGTDAASILDILSNIISQEKDEYTVRLKNIQLDAVLSIQWGENTRFIYYKLNSYTDIPLKEDEVWKKLVQSIGI